MPERLKTKLARVSSRPGVYLMKDGRGRILYVGKARNLRKRLTAYFHSTAGMDGKTGALVDKIFDFETILTASEKEALILESNLIKRHRPRYNVILKDDKRYPCLRLDLQHPYPNLTIVRKPQKDGAAYFGPFASAGAVRETLKIINKTFKLRKCKNREFRTRTRPCLHCQMQRCQAPCCMDIDPADYEEMVKEVVLFLKGRTVDLVQKIKRDMTAAAQAQQFEKAAVLRDRLFALQKTVEKQVAVNTDLKDRDVLAIAHGEDLSLITLLTVRGGYLQGSRHFSFATTLASETEMIEAVVRQYYEKGHHIPPEILLPASVPEVALLEQWLGELRQGRVRLLKPQRGEKARLLRLAEQNANDRLASLAAAQVADQLLLQRLQRRLGLDRPPLRIECFDNSNISGSTPVASMVVFEKGRAAPEAYRKFRIQSVPAQDDYAYMAEILKRRFRLRAEPLPKPDLLMVDGGKGQLNVATVVLAELGLANSFGVAGIAKKNRRKGEEEDKIFLPGRANPVNFSADRELLLFLQRVRDEAHRFAIQYHRQRRRKKALASTLDNIPHIGAKRKEVLLKHFGSLSKIRAATIEEMTGLPGMTRSAAKAVQKALGKAP